MPRTKNPVIMLLINIKVSDDSFPFILHFLIGKRNLSLDPSLSIKNSYVWDECLFNIDNYYVEWGYHVVRIHFYKSLNQNWYQNLLLMRKSGFEGRRSFKPSSHRLGFYCISVYIAGVKILQFCLSFSFKAKWFFCLPSSSTVNQPFCFCLL